MVMYAASTLRIARQDVDLHGVVSTGFQKSSGMASCASLTFGSCTDSDATPPVICGETSPPLAALSACSDMPWNFCVAAKAEVEVHPWLQLRMHTRECDWGAEGKAYQAIDMQPSDIS